MILGDDYKFYVGNAPTFSGGQFAVLSGEQSSSVNITCDLIETTTKGGDWKTFLSGKKGATANVTLFATNTDINQVKMIDSLMEGETVYCFWGKVNTQNPDSSQGYIFSALVTSIGESAEKGGIVSRDISVTANSYLTRFPRTEATTNE